MKVTPSNIIKKIVFGQEPSRDFLFYLRIYTIFTYLSLSLKNKISPLRFLSINKEHISFEKGNYSKHKINKSIPAKFLLKSILISLDQTLDVNVTDLEKKFAYPFIIKPDWGESSLGVWKINNTKELKKRLFQILKRKIQYMAQEYCKYEKEYDILYIASNKNPQKKKILDITRIDPPIVKGDGKSNIRQLILQQFKEYQEYLFHINKDRLDKIPKKRKNVRLTDINSKLYGSKYSDLKKNLSKSEDKIIKNLNEIGKFRLAKVTVKANDESELINGELKVIEINILYPLMNSILGTNLTHKQRKNMIRNYIQKLMPIVKESTLKLSVWQVINFYIKNLSQKNKLKNLSKKC